MKPIKVFFDTTALKLGHQGRGIGLYTSMLSQKFSTTSHPNISFTSSALEANLIHYPFFDFFKSSLPIRKSTKTIVTIHDTIPLLYPTQFPKGVKGSLSLLHQRLSLKSTAGIITDSLSSKNDIVKTLAYSPEKIHTIPLAGNPAIKPTTKQEQQLFKSQHNLPDNFLLYVGDINYNKNLPRLLKAIEPLTIHLVIVTRANHSSSIPEAKAITTTIKQHQLKSKVTFLKISDDHQLSNLYSLATWYIQPSLYEGFGLPVLEAMQTNTPVLVANTSSLPEVAGSAAVYFDPTDTSSITNAITNALSLTPKQRQELIANGTDQLKRFSWNQTTNLTLSAYQQVFSQ